jgi:DNA processing protein
MKARAPEADPDCDDRDIITRARIALACVCEPGEAGLADLIDSRGPTAVVAALLSGAPVRIPRAASIGARLAELDLDAQLTRARELGVRVVVPGELEWPGQLDDLGANRPLALWCWGEANLRLHALNSVAMVGARACTRYGEVVAREWSAALASERISIISGGAYGIDAAAHRGALAVDGSTICVVAGGVDQAYPRGHEGLFTQIVERGVVISEAPLGETVRRRRFLTRNRVIAALATATCVVEASRRSGSSRTAAYAADLNRQVYAVPGPVTSETSVGTHRLIQDRVAILASDVEDLRTGVQPVRVSLPTSNEDPQLSAGLQEVLDALPGSHNRGLSVDATAVRCGLDPHQTREWLLAAQLAGYARCSDDGLWVYMDNPGRA